MTSQYGGTQNSRVSKFKQLSKRTYGNVDGKIIPLDYEIKNISRTSTIKIQNPTPMISNTSGDKQVIVKYLEFYDGLGLGGFSGQQLLFRLVAENQRNNFDSDGNQTNVIGYLTPDTTKNSYLADSQPFEMDSMYPVVISLEKFNYTNNSWNVFTFENTDSYIYSDIQIVYDLEE